MVRHAASHGFAVFMCTILSALLIEVLAPLIPKYISYLENISKFIVTFFFYAANNPFRSAGIWAK